MQTAKSSPKLWQYCCAILIVTTIVFAALAAIGYSQLGSAQAKNSDLSSQVDSLKSQLSQDNKTINSLTNQVSDLRNSVSTLNTQVSNLQSQLNALKSNIVNITELSGVVKVTAVCPLLSTCTAVAIVFYSGSPSHATVSSAVFSNHSYFVVLDNGVTYSITIVYTVFGFLGLGDTVTTCPATPSTFTTPTGPSTASSMSFFC